MELDELEPRTAGIARTCPATDRPTSGWRGSTIEAGAASTPPQKLSGSRRARTGPEAVPATSGVPRIGSVVTIALRTTRPALAEATQSRIVP